MRGLRGGLNDTSLLQPLAFARAGGARLVAAARRLVPLALMTATAGDASSQAAIGSTADGASARIWAYRGRSWARALVFGDQLLRHALPVSLVLAVASLAGLLFALRTSTLALDSYGLIRSLPVVYLLGLVGLVGAAAVASRDPRRGGLLIVAYAFVFAAVIWLTPYVLEGTARFRTSYTNLGYVDPLLRGDGLAPGHFLYHNWPLFPLLVAGVVEVLHVGTMTVLAFYPVVMILVYTAFVVVLSAILTRRMERRSSLAVAAGAAAWSYVVFNWTDQDYFSPQALAYVFFLGLLCLLAYVALERDGRLDARQTFAVIGLFFLVVATHVLTSIICLGVLLALIATGHLRRPTILLTCGLIFICWQVTVGGPFFVFYGEHLLTSILGAGLLNFFGANVASRVTGDPEHAVVAQLRMLATAVPALLAMLVVASYALRTPEARARLRRFRAPALPKPISFAVAVVVGVGLCAPVSVYGGEMLIRMLFFTLPALAALIGIGMRALPFRALFFAVVLVMAPLHLVTHYGNEMLDYVSPDEIAGFRYISTLAPANVYGAFPAASTYNTIRLDARNAYLFRNLQPASIADYANPMLHHEWIHEDWPLYVAVSRGDDAAMKLFQNRPDFIAQARAFLDSDPDYTRVFANADVSVYRYNKGPTGPVPAAESELTGAKAANRGSPPLWLAIVCVLGIGLAVVEELLLGARHRRRIHAAVVRLAPLVAVCSLLVMAIAAYRVAELIGYFA